MSVLWVVAGIADLMVAGATGALMVAAMCVRARPVLVGMLGLFAVANAANGVTLLLPIGRLWSLLTSVLDFAAAVMIGATAYRLRREGRRRREHGSASVRCP